MNKSRLIAITIIRNEENNFLRPWLKNIGRIADYHIFLDDASDDNTPQIIAQHLKTHPGELHHRKTSLFKQNEPALRGELWEYTRRIAHDGDWILIVDADEFYDGNLKKIKKKLLKNKFPNANVLTVSCLDMWTAREYRTDGYWSPLYNDIRLIRYRDIPFGANSTQLHQPPYPAGIDTSKIIKIFIPKIHLAYLRDSDRIRRYKFYTKNVSPDTDPVSFKHAQSIISRDTELTPYFNIRRDIWALTHFDIAYFQVRHITKKYRK